jgi:hypothetical protein
MANTELDQTAEKRRASMKRLDAIGWGIFFIWIGIAFLANFSWGIALLGMGIIMLGVQMGRMHFGHSIEGFGLVMGILFVVTGVWELLKATLGKNRSPAASCRS